MSIKRQKNQTQMKINLKELFGQSVPNSFEFRQAVGQEFIDRIVNRTKKRGIDKDGKKFKGYSKSYRKSLEFKSFKGNKRKVDLTLTGDLLGQLDIISDSKNTIKLGWDDEEQRSKAEGHINGGGNLPRRDFFGLPKKEIEDIKSGFKSEILDSIKGTRGEKRKDLLVGLIKRLQGESEDAG